MTWKDWWWFVVVPGLLKQTKWAKGWVWRDWFKRNMYGVMYGGKVQWPFCRRGR